MKMYKKLLLGLFICLFFFSALTGNIAARGTTDAWYIKRNGQKRPLLQKDQEFIYKYDAYFIDKKLDDDSERKILYLTFDLGYENGNTEKILDTLYKENVPAAFFVLDNIILKNLDLVTRMINEGHLVCNHTKNHKNLCHASEEEIKRCVLDLEKLYEEKTGECMAKYFRFPEGKFNEASLATVQRLGYKTIFWSFAYADWDNKSQPQPTRAIKKIIDNTHNGAVILLHPTSETNAKIMPELIKAWREMGYSFGTLDELVSTCN